MILPENAGDINITKGYCEQVDIEKLNPHQYKKVMGYANLVGSEGSEREKYIAAVLEAERLDDVSEHFIMLRRTWDQDGRTWNVVCKGQEERSRMDYILEMDHRIFRNVSGREPRHNSDHYLVLGCL